MTKKHSLTKTIASAALIIGLSSGIAVAQKDGALRLDTNGDQQITQSEFLAGAEARFNAIDVNGDNFISDDEHKAHREVRKKERLDSRFERADLNDDGVISKDELEDARNAKSEKRAERKAQRKAKLDLNGDGTIDDAEKAEARATREAHKAERKANRKDRPKRAQSSKPDANGDGFVSREEHMAASVKMFEFLDANYDGVLTEGEGKKRKKKRGNKGARP